MTKSRTMKQLDVLRELNISVWVGHRVQSRAEQGLRPKPGPAELGEPWVDSGDVRQDGEHGRRSRSGCRGC